METGTFTELRDINIAMIGQPVQSDGPRLAVSDFRIGSFASAPACLLVEQKRPLDL
jgi:hypothetical protein